MILVDRVRHYASANHHNKLWCHMASDVGLDELHEFARGLGLPLRAFDGDHYDLPPHLRERAVALGAVEVTSRELLLRMQPRRPSVAKLLAARERRGG